MSFQKEKTLMKIILSRKGFDSGIGKVASPIFPSGKLYSLPIPEAFPSHHSKHFSEIRAGEHNLGTIVQDLTEKRIKAGMFAHLDPDLNRSSIPRPANWLPTFGQTGAAEKHLQNQGVEAGDIFLFYGWFRQVELESGHYRYIRNTPDVHVLFGWLQVEQCFPVDSLAVIPTWAHEHPHCKARKYHHLDSLYISTSKLRLPKRELDLPGAGTFRRFAPSLCLTAPQRSRSVWQLPSWIYQPQADDGPCSTSCSFTVL